MHTRLVDSDSYRERVVNSKLFANSEFVRFLLRKNLITPTNNPSAGDMIIYFAADNPKHAGIIVEPNKKVRSKWGSLPIFEHGLWQVSEDYGQEIKYYKFVGTVDADKYFECYLNRENA